MELVQNPLSRDPKKARIVKDQPTAEVEEASMLEEVSDLSKINLIKAIKSIAKFFMRESM